MNQYLPRNKFIIALLIMSIIVLSLISAAEYDQVQSLSSRQVSTTTMTSTSSLASDSFVIFHQMNSCGFMTTPWAVTVGNETEVQPPGKAVPNYVSGETEANGYDANLSTIAFFLSNGAYSYAVNPQWLGGNSTTGTITVQGTDVVLLFNVGCQLVSG